MLSLGTETLGGQQLVEVMPRGLEVPQRGGHGPNLPPPPKRRVDPRALEHGRGRNARAGAISFELGQEARAFRDGHSELECCINAVRASAFMLLPHTAFPLHGPPRMDAPQKIREWLEEIIHKTGWSAAHWASEADVAASTVQRALKPEYPFVTSSRTLSKLAAAAGVSPPDLVDPAPNTKPATFLEIRYEVGAGMWRRVDDVQESYGSGPVMADPTFAGFPQWLERVVSDSMDLEYPVGTLLHVVDAIPIHYSIRHGDHVVIERKQMGGSMVERTVKEVVVTPKGGVQFWGRSRNPKWNQALQMNGDRDDETEEVSIAALVLGSYRPRR
ncbi:hypothetical protein DDF67_09625 [Caulobacter endophyticus]|uniref:Peptidase S24/S26A/S26B/S26C domain-containing protein n=1 Tax=Caulobacter endophyticus TaxID=2172652 RepID=A0A2T9K3X9_9CAUL|nr:hypothetical protein DDF67_09625 [Caulobacter endophyticus]